MTARADVRFRLTFTCGVKGADFVYEYAATADDVEDAGGEYMLLRKVCIGEAIRLTKQLDRTTVRLRGRRGRRRKGVAFVEKWIEKQQPDGTFERVRYPTSMQPHMGMWP